MSKSLAALWLLISLTMPSIAGCAGHASTSEIQAVSATSSGLRIKVPPQVRKSCEPADLPRQSAGRPNEWDYQTFGILQTGMLDICDQRRQLGVDAMDMFNENAAALTEALRPPRNLWERIFGKKRLKVSSPPNNKEAATP